MDKLDQYIHECSSNVISAAVVKERGKIFDDSLEQDALELESTLEEHEKVYRDPDILVQKMFDRDCPVHEKWCAKSDAKWVKNKIRDYLKNAVFEMGAGTKKDYDPYEVHDNVSVVFPTVETIDLFRMLEVTPSFKSDDFHWSGYAEQFNKIWSEVDIRNYFMGFGVNCFFRKFDRTEELIRLLETVSDRLTETPEDEEDEKRHKKRIISLKEVLYRSWYSSIMDLVDSLDESKGMMWLMMVYRYAIGAVPCEKIVQAPARKVWLSARHTVPSPYSLLVLHDKRMNQYTCWNYVNKSNPVLVPMDENGGPLFLTKLREILKAEYVFSEMFKKQIRVHLSEGYILVEDRDSVAEAAIRTKEAKKASEGDEEDREFLKALDKKDDANEEAEWKQQLKNLDDEVRYQSKRVQMPQRLVLQGLARPRHLPYVDRLYNISKTRKERSGGSRASSSSEKSKQGSKEHDPAADLVKLLQKQIMSGESSAQALNQMINSLVGADNKHLNRATKKISEIANARHKFIETIHGNLKKVEAHMAKIETVAGGATESGTEDTYGLIPVKAMFAGMANHTASVDSMAQQLESTLAAMGVRPDALNEEEMFVEFDARVNVAASSAIAKAQMEMRRTMDVINKMMDNVEGTIENFTSAPLGTHAVTEGHSGIDGITAAYDMDPDFLPLGSDVAVVDQNIARGHGSGGNKSLDDVYAYCQSKISTIFDMYKTLVGRYKDLLKSFNEQQEATMSKVANEESSRSKAIDARRIMKLYKALYDTQAKFNRERLEKLEKAFEKVEAKIAQTDAKIQESKRDANSRLQELKGKLDAMLIVADSDDGPWNTERLEDCVIQSDEYVDSLMQRRTQELRAVSEAYRENLTRLRETFEMAEARKDARRKQLEAQVSFVPSQQQQVPSSSSTTTTEASGSGWTEDDHRKVFDQNKSIYDMNKAAYDEYTSLKDDVINERARAVHEAEEKNLAQRAALDKARIARQYAIKEKSHVRSLKRYSTIVKRDEAAKRRKMDSSGEGFNMRADALTVSQNAAKPQLLVVKDHFRKAKIMHGVPDKTMDGIRNTVKDRWEDFIQSVFPQVTIIDIHGVKSWALNDQAVVTNIFSPFLKLRYGVTYKNKGGLTHTEKEFFSKCDYYTAGLLHNNCTGLSVSDELLEVFHQNEAEAKHDSVFSGIEHKH